MNTYKAVAYKDGYETRYSIVDIETGEVLDDAQGYGYKTAQKAYKAYTYKTQGGREKDKEIIKFWKENKELLKYVEKLENTWITELCKGEINLKDIQRWIKEEKGVDVSLNYIKKIDLVIKKEIKGRIFNE